MHLFSERHGFKPTRTAVQLESMDADLRTSLWNATIIYYWEQAPMNTFGHWEVPDQLTMLVRQIWVLLLKGPLDNMPSHFPDLRQYLRNHFFSCEWNEVYDFIEFVANYYPDEDVNQQVIAACNVILQQEVSAYRFVGGQITQMTSETEIVEIEQALDASQPLAAVNTHLQTALQLLADRKNPDYRNSIKESISAVEALCRLIANDPKATLGEALKKIESSKLSLHSALKEAFLKLYGYTSDADGIRHALLDEPNLDFEDAKFMLVACSAFVNYLTSKASKAGIKL